MKLTCRWTQFWMEYSPDELGGFAARHLAGCPHCQAAQQTLRQLEGALVKHQLAAPAPVEAPIASRLPWALGVTALAAVIGLLVMTGNGPESTLPIAAFDPPTVANTAGPDDGTPAPASPPNRARSLPSAALIGSVARGLDDMVSDDPLQRELRALEADGRRGLRKLMAIGGVGRVR